MTKPIATPISISCAAVSAPAPEKIDSPDGTGASGAIRKARARVKTILTRLGMVASLAIGAARTNPPMRKEGHHRRATICETSAALTTRGCMAVISRSHSECWCIGHA